MKIFVSSVIGGMEEHRDAVARAATVLHMEVIRAEDFGASPASPQQTCLAAARQADVVVLVLGERYGAVQPSGHSATHEEWLEARDRAPVLAFVQDGVEFEPRQREFIDEARAWAGGLYTESFSDSDDLFDRAVGRLHELTLARQAGTPDEDEALARATTLLPERVNSNGPTVVVAVASTPRQAVLRPAELESASIVQDVVAAALTGEFAVLDLAAGTDHHITGDTLVVSQERRANAVHLDEQGDLLVVRDLDRPAAPGVGMPVLIEEDIRETIATILRFTGFVLERIDPVHRITHVGLVVGLLGGGYSPWRTRAEMATPPTGYSISQRAGDRVVVSLTPPIRPRAALQHETVHLAEDLTVR